MATGDDAEQQRWQVPAWVIPLMIGVVTVTAGVFTWRAGQLGSAAAFEDRQAVGQTISQQEQYVEARLGAVDQASAYVRYLADYTEAGSLDGLAEQIGAEGADGAAAALHSYATEIRRLASGRAVAAYVFTEQDVLANFAATPTEALPFHLPARVAQLEAEAVVGIGSPGSLDPDLWAARANDLRHRVRALRFGAMVLLTAALVLTIAQLTDRRMIRRAGATMGGALFLGVVAIMIVGPF